MSRLLTLSCILAFGAVACSSSDSPTDPTGASGTFTATVDGQPWNGQIEATRTGYNGFVFGVVGVDGGIGIALSVNTSDPDNQAPGTIDLTSGSVGAEISEGGDIWYAVGSGGSGTLNLNSLDENGASGTFSFVAGPVGGSAPDGTRSITNGSFNLTF
ncbi:MAG: hypothetical protein HKO53_13885 [Gemmatimonadetes bacterium]|nr:hypothetical protein [Gemmatimonadota bacterium]NNM34160.1 hypothetical protein [Gemmatimonadota bacterium]